MGLNFEGEVSYGFAHGWGSFEFTENITLEGLWNMSRFIHGKMFITDDQKRVKEVILIKNLVFFAMKKW